MIILSLLIVCTLVCPMLQSQNLTQENITPKRAIVIGASIGMGREISKLLAADGYIVGMAVLPHREITLLQNRCLI